SYPWKIEAMRFAPMADATAMERNWRAIPMSPCPNRDPMLGPTRKSATARTAPAPSPRRRVPRTIVRRSESEEANGRLRAIAFGRPRVPKAERNPARVSDQENALHSSGEMFRTTRTRAPKVIATNRRVATNRKRVPRVTVDNPSRVRSFEGESTFLPYPTGPRGTVKRHRWGGTVLVAGGGSDLRERPGSLGDCTGPGFTRARSGLDRSGGGG